MHFDINVKLRKVRPDAKVPEFGTSGSAGCDLFACNTTNITDYEYRINPHETVMIPIGFEMEIPYGYMGCIYARSGMASKKSLRPANCVGVIDSDFRGEVMVPLHNDSDRVKTVAPGDKIAQIIFEKIHLVEFEIVDQLSDTSRGAGGFGSTGE